MNKVFKGSIRNFLTCTPRVNNASGGPILMTLFSEAMGDLKGRVTYAA